MARREVAGKKKKKKRGRFLPGKKEKVCACTEQIRKCLESSVSRSLVVRPQDGSTVPVSIVSMVLLKKPHPEALKIKVIAGCAMYAHNLSFCKVEAEGSGVQGPLLIHNELRQAWVT